MKRLIAVAMLSLLATILLAGCHAATNHDIKPVSSPI
jgi:predicted small secreted protein